mmetsp:Transcript_47971/g.63502  ORF Transcript_47971/g.63502 Transcript_47971/m.63502 type:complete len:121 (+) Transcript_47971:1116-1478(+)
MLVEEFILRSVHRFDHFDITDAHTGHIRVETDKVVCPGPFKIDPVFEDEVVVFFAPGFVRTPRDHVCTSKQGQMPVAQSDALAAVEMARTEIVENSPVKNVESKRHKKRFQKGPKHAVYQ